MSLCLCLRVRMLKLCPDTLWTFHHLQPNMVQWYIITSWTVMQNNWVAIFNVFKEWNNAQAHLPVLFTFCVHPNDLFFIVRTSSQSLQLPRDLNKQQKNKVEQECLLFLPRLDWNQMYSRTECKCSPFQNSTTQEESNSNPKLHPPEWPEAMQYLYWQSTGGILTKPKSTLSRTALGLEPNLYQTVPAYTQLGLTTYCILNYKM